LIQWNSHLYIETDPEKRATDPKLRKPKRKKENAHPTEDGGIAEIYGTNTDKDIMIFTIGRVTKRIILWNGDTFELLFCLAPNNIFGNLIGVILNESSYLSSISNGNYGKVKIFNGKLGKDKATFVSQMNSMLLVVRKANNEIGAVRMTDGKFKKFGN
jgi:hypothetical protein